MARQQLKEDYIAMRRSYPIIEGVRGDLTQQSRKAASASKGNLPGGAASGSVDDGGARSLPDTAELVKKGYIAEAKATGLGSEGIGEGMHGSTF